MKVRKVVSEPIAVDEDGVKITGSVNAAVSANVNEPGTSRVSSKQRVRVVQRDGKTEVHEEAVSTETS